MKHQTEKSPCFHGANSDNRKCLGDKQSQTREQEVGGAILFMARSILTPYIAHLSSTIK